MAEKKNKDEPKGSVTKTLMCGCKHPYQDQRYGLGMRLHNVSPKNKGWRCTVCERVKA